MFDGGGGGQCPQHVAQPQIRLDVVGLGGFDQRIDERAGARTRLGVREEPRLPPNDEGPDGVFGGVVVDRQIAALEVARQARPLPVQVAQRTTEHPLHCYVRRVLVLDGLLGDARSITREMGEELLRSRRLPPMLPL